VKAIFEVIIFHSVKAVMDSISHVNIMGTETCLLIRYPWVIIAPHETLVADLEISDVQLLRTCPAPNIDLGKLIVPGIGSR
jgi:hypothetical protein